MFTTYFLSFAVGQWKMVEIKIKTVKISVFLKIFNKFG